MRFYSCPSFSTTSWLDGKIDGFILSRVQGVFRYGSASSVHRGRSGIEQVSENRVTSFGRISRFRSVEPSSFLQLSVLSLSVRQRMLPQRGYIAILPVLLSVQPRDRVCRQEVLLLQLLQILALLLLGDEFVG